MKEKRKNMKERKKNKSKKKNIIGIEAFHSEI